MGGFRRANRYRMVGLFLHDGIGVGQQFDLASARPMAAPIQARQGVLEGGRFPPSFHLRGLVRGIDEIETAHSARSPWTISCRNESASSRPRTGRGRCRKCQSRKNVVRGRHRQKAGLTAARQVRGQVDFLQYAIVDGPDRCRPRTISKRTRDGVWPDGLVVTKHKLHAA